MLRYTTPTIIIAKNIKLMTLVPMPSPPSSGAWVRRSQSDAQRGRVMIYAAQKAKTLLSFQNRNPPNISAIIPQNIIAEYVYQSQSFSPIISQAEVPRAKVKRIAAQ